MSAEARPRPLFDVWDGEVVPRSFDAAFVALSFVVSLLGAASTLEVINRRTARKGGRNHFLLFVAAITMGGVAIFCMHYIGNRAIILGSGEPELQIQYSSACTVLSFFLAVVVLLAAFIAIGTSNPVSWWRVATGATLAGGAICGMHYLGNASISNYVCIYSAVHVVFAAVIAVAATGASLALFFVLRASWTSSWWKRAASAVLLAGAVSGMHWCASTGTQYRLVALHNGATKASRDATVIMVICLSLATCFVIVGTVVCSARVRSRSANNKAQQVVLATAIFDPDGRVLVSPDGLLPSEKIADAFLEKRSNEAIGVTHPLFRWMFQASRNWSNINSIVDVMIDHLDSLPRRGRNSSRNGIRLLDEQGDLIEHYDVIFKELFCAAALALAEKTKSHLRQVGILWDEILPTGDTREGDPGRQSSSSLRAATSDSSNGSDSSAAATLAEKGEVQRRPTRPQERLYSGSLLFLVRRAESAREVTALEAAGYRFADPRQVAGLIGASMQIQTGDGDDDMAARLADMAAYARHESARPAAGVHLGLFAVRARADGQDSDVLARADARHLLPAAEMRVDRLEPWQLVFLRQLDGLAPAGVAAALERCNPLSAQGFFASRVLTSLAALRAEVGADLLERATLSARAVQVPCRPPAAASSSSSTSSHTATLVAFRLVIPAHAPPPGPGLVFVPMSLFKAHQRAHADPAHRLAFSRAVHREMARVLHTRPPPPPTPTPVASRPPTAVAVAAPPSQPPSPTRPQPARFQSWFGGPTTTTTTTTTATTSSTTTPAPAPPPATTTTTAVDGDGVPIPAPPRLFRRRTESDRSGSTAGLWSPPADDDDGSGGGDRRPSDDSCCVDEEEEEAYDAFDEAAGGGLGRHVSVPPRVRHPQRQHRDAGLGGIMVSQEVSVRVQDCEGGAREEGFKLHKVSSGPQGSIGKGSVTGAGVLGNKAGITVVQAERGGEEPTFVDELLAGWVRR